MKFNVKKITSVALATLITVGSTSFAASFTDVADNYWGKPYIERGKELGFINGYEDGTFKPSASISRLQTISLSARLLNLPEAEITKAKQKYEKTLLDNKVPEWAVADMSVALSKGIIDTNILNKLFNANGAQTLSSREEVTIYIAKAIGLQKEVEALPSNIDLPFNDKSKVDKLAKPYVYILEKNGIISGDGYKNFNPKDAINRAEMSKVITSAYDYMQKKDEEKPTPDPAIKTVTGTIFSTFTTGGISQVIIETPTGEKENYKIDKDSILRLDGKIVNQSELVVGLKVKADVSIGQNNELGFIKTLDAESQINKIQGSIYDINTYAKTLSIEYIENGLRKKTTFNLSENTEILLDGKVVSLSDLKVDDIVNVEIINNKITKINANAHIRDVEGILKNINSKYIEMELKDGTRVSYNLHNNVEVIRDNRSVSLDDLRKGDKVTITVKDNLVTKLDAQIVKKTIEGKISRKSIGYDKSEITVTNRETQRDETYIIPNDSRVYLDGKLSRLDQLELGYLVELSLEGEEVIEINSVTTTINNRHIGTISYVGKTYLEINLESSFGEKVEIIINNDTLMYEEFGKPISINDLRKGDGVLITGEKYGNRLNATRIMKFLK